jgi:hypothetical protein
MVSSGVGFVEPFAFELSDGRISPLRRSLGGTGRLSAVTRFGLTVTACNVPPRA